MESQNAGCRGGGSANQLLCCVLMGTVKAVEKRSARRPNMVAVRYQIVKPTKTHTFSLKYAKCSSAEINVNN